MRTGILTFLAWVSYASSFQMKGFPSIVPRSLHSFEILNAATIKGWNSFNRCPRQRTIRMDLSVTLRTPLGIIFEEAEPNGKKGVIVSSLQPGGNADLDGRILVGDKVGDLQLTLSLVHVPAGADFCCHQLISTSAVILESTQKPILGIGGGVQNTNWKREMIATGNMDFETVMNAIRSNSGRYGYKDVRLIFRRTEKSVPRSTETIKRLQGPDTTASSEPDLPLRTGRDAWDEK